VFNSVVVQLVGRSTCFSIFFVSDGAFSMPIPLRRLSTTEELAPWLGLRVDGLTEMLSAKSMKPFYEQHKLRARNRRSDRRIVYEAVDELAVAQHEIAAALEPLHEFPKCVRAYVRGCSTFKNAAQHLNKEFVLHADIVNFFGSLTQSAVISLFVAVGTKPRIAEALAHLCTLDGTVPQGARSSPILSNILVGPLDADLLVLARAHNSEYTRYADDIVFSGSEVPSKQAISSILARHGFALNERKFKVQRRGQPQFVSGLCVCDTKPRLPSKLKRQLQLDVYYATRFGGANHARHRKRDPDTEYRRVDGLLSYAMGIERDFARPLREHWAIAFHLQRKSVTELVSPAVASIPNVRNSGSHQVEIADTRPVTESVLDDERSKLE
jgi:RNA-directed DNA polymerase